MGVVALDDSTSASLRHGVLRAASAGVGTGLISTQRGKKR